MFLFEKAHNYMASYLEELIAPYQPTTALCSQYSGLLVVPKASKSRVGARACTLSFQTQDCGS